MSSAPQAVPLRFLLLRCGSPEGAEGVARLTSDGRFSAEVAGYELNSYHPKIILCSEYKYAKEHARIIQRLIHKKTRIVQLAILKPITVAVNLEAILEEVETHVELGEINMILCVAHEPHFSSLIADLVNDTAATPGSVLVCYVAAPSWSDLRDAKARRAGKLMFTPTAHPPETELHPKIQSKMQVSTFLAGFTFTVLMAVLTGSEYGNTAGSKAYAAAAVIVCLTLATALFVVAVYMYDQLSMPRTYWQAPSEHHRFPQDLWRSFLRDRVQYGTVYAYMVWTWRFLFTTAVILALLGFLGLVFLMSTGVVVGLALAGVLLVIVFYVVLRPRLGVVD